MSSYALNFYLDATVPVTYQQHELRFIVFYYSLDRNTCINI